MILREEAKRRIGIAVAAILSLVLFAQGLAAMLGRDTFLRNYWGGLVFAPIACLLGAVCFFLVLHAGAKKRERRAPKLRGRAARRARQAARYRSALDDHDRSWRGGS